MRTEVITGFFMFLYLIGMNNEDLEQQYDVLTSQTKNK